jgi:hypothetical protein
MTIFVILAVPETKGVPIEELSEVILNKHWLWSRVAAGTAPRDDAAVGAARHPSKAVDMEKGIH